MKRVDELLTQRARELRSNSTKAERLMWLRLRHYKPRFTRQLVIGSHIVDLACREAKLAIELDGGQHADSVARDDARTAVLETQGWAVLRLWNSEVQADPDAAAEHVLNVCTARLGGATHPQPLPSREGRKRVPRVP